MAYRIAPLPITDNLSAYASPLILQINAEAIIVSGSQPAPYTLWLMRRVCSGESRHDVAIAAQRWILHETGLIALGPLFAWLSALDVLGRVDTTPLTEPMLATLGTQAHSLHNMVFSTKTQFPQQLIDGANARKASLAARYGTVIAPYLTYLDRVVTRLLPFIPQ